MKINWLWINSYKTIKEQKIEFESDYSRVYVLVGKNASGKSNVLEAISHIFSSLYIDPNNPKFAYGISYEIKNKIWIYVNTLDRNLGFF